METPTKNQLLYWNPFNPLSVRLAALKQHDKDIGMFAGNEAYTPGALALEVEQSKELLGSDFPTFTQPAK